MMVLAGCTSSPGANPPSTTTTTAPFTHAQVLTWVTPTLGNGASFVASLSRSSTAEQMVAASRPLSTAVSVSLHELALIPWKGGLQRKEAGLVDALLRVQDLTAKPPESGYLSQLDDDILGVMGALRALNGAVNGPRAVT